MILRIFPLENEIVFKQEYIEVLYISNRKYFTKIVSNLYRLTNGLPIDEKIGLEMDGQLIDFKKDVIVLVDLFTIDFNQKKILSRLYEYIANVYTLDYEKSQKFQKSVNDIIIELEDVIGELQFSTEYKENPTLSDFLKMISLKIDGSEDLTILERMLCYIDLCSFSKMYKLVILVNAKLYFTEDEIVEIYRYSKYNGVTILIIEYGIPNGALQYENILWIDEDYEESIIR